MEENKKALKLPEKEFLQTFKNVPRLAINLLVTDVHGKILLVRRSIPPFAGFWHFPGSFLLKNETIGECQKRIAKVELGLILNRKFKLSLMGAFENLDGDPRGHVIDLVYGLKTDNASKIKVTKEILEVKFFEKLPKGIGFKQKETLQKLGYK